VSGPYGVGPAPPDPLVLWDVDYDGVAFVVDDDAAASALSAFDTRYREARRAAAATGAIRDRLGTARSDPEGD
jgi:hypothetical protein